MWARSIRQFGGLDRPIPIEALLPRLRPNSNEPGCITDESVAIRESYSNIQVQTRGVLVVEGESHSYVGEVVRVSARPANRAHPFVHLWMVQALEGLTVPTQLGHLSVTQL